MKKVQTFLFAMFLMSCLVACKQAPKAPEAKVEDAQEVATQDNATANGQALSINTEKSTLTWIGTKPTGQHTGTLSIKDGNINVKDSQIVGGTFTIDINSLNPTDMDEENNGKLAGHLKSADFFDAENYPEAAFEITGVKAYNPSGDEAAKELTAGANHLVTGNLRMKEKINSITFPANINISEAGVAAKANFNINRTDWGLSYGADESLGDKFIRPLVNIALDLQATP